MMKVGYLTILFKILFCLNFIFRTDLNERIALLIEREKKIEELEKSNNQKLVDGLIALKKREQEIYLRELEYKKATSISSIRGGSSCFSGIKCADCSKLLSVNYMGLYLIQF